MLFLKHCIIGQLEEAHLPFKANIYDPVFSSD
jgi:hypothetical protein